MLTMVMTITIINGISIGSGIFFNDRLSKWDIWLLF